MWNAVQKLMASIIVIMVFALASLDRLVAPLDVSVSALFLVPIIFASLAFFVEGGMLAATVSSGLFFYGRGGEIHRLKVDDVLLLACFFLVAYFVGRMRRALHVTERLAACDPLTGVYNRRHFTTRLLEEMERARRLKNPLAVLMIDVNNFKHFNDQFGHARGDFVLEQVARILRLHSRRTDVIARIGGDEFAVVLADADPPGAHIVAKRLRKQVALEGTGSLAFLGSVTISIGVGEWNRSITSPEELMELADQALYSDKSGNHQSTQSGCAEALALAS